jgi:hypothetical protein
VGGRLAGNRKGDFAQSARLAAHLDDPLARLDPNRKKNRVNAGTLPDASRGRTDAPADSGPGGRVAPNDVPVPRPKLTLMLESASAVRT